MVIISNGVLGGSYDPSSFLGVMRVRSMDVNAR
jgi:hypothetical protein